MNHDVVERDNPAEESRDLAPRLDQETSLVVQIAQAELNQAVTTARAFPRSVARSMQNITSLATLDAVTAQECIYALPRDGKVIAGELVKLACKRHVDDLATGRDRGLYFDTDAASMICNFAGMLQHTAGPLAGKPLTLQPWQVFRHGSMFGWKKTATRTRRFRDSYHQVGKKNGKNNQG